MSNFEEALAYHRSPRPGKTAVVPTKPCISQRDLSLAYTPGVATPCLKIADQEDDAYLYTNKGNLVAVVSNGSAVLGLGNIGAIAGKPVMEGKAVLFKRFAGVDVFDLELNTKDPDEIVRICEVLCPSFGGINLEDIQAPECFYIEEELKRRLNIPVFHDDQHGTAIISGAALLNALEIVGKEISKLQVVFCGAGAAGIACAKFYESLGVRRENVLMCDSKGVIHTGREDLDPSHPRYSRQKTAFARSTNARTLADALEGADVFVGVSAANMVTQQMVRSMASDPIVFALANPDPEIAYDEAIAARKDVIIATGRSDCPNQVNNVLGFPFIFRGALDVRAKEINEEMKIAAARSLAALAREDVPDIVLRAYHTDKLSFGREYLIPKPFDPRVLTWETLAVARAAVETGVARKENVDWEAYRDELEQLLGAERQMVRRLIHQAQRKPKRIVFAEGDHENVLRAAQMVIDEQVGVPVLLGPPAVVEAKQKQLGLTLEGATIVEPRKSPLFEQFVDRYYDLRSRKGVSHDEATRHMRRRHYFGSMMVREGKADVFISGASRFYPSAIRPMLRVISDKIHGHTVAAVHIAIKDGKHFFLADTSVNIDPTAEQLVDIAEDVHRLARDLGIEPRIGLLSFSCFGTVRNASSDKMRQAVELLWEKHPTWAVDGEVQSDIAVLPELLEQDFRFSRIAGGANCLVFPNLDAANISYRLLRSLGDVTFIGPVLCGLDYPMHIIQRGSSPDDIVHIAAIGAVQAEARQNTRSRVKLVSSTGGDNGAARIAATGR